MSFGNFMMFLQQLLTMVEKKDEYSIALARSILQSTIALAKASGKVDGMTLRTMMMTVNRFDNLVQHAEEFAGKPGDISGNEQKRRRLEMTLRPGC